MIKKWILRVLYVSLMLSLMSFTTQKAVTIEDEVNVNVLDQIDTVIYAVDFEQTDDVNYYLKKLCNNLDIDYSDMFSLIAFETGKTFDAKITNPNSGARGLIQFTNSTASTLRARNGKKFKNVNELINEYPTAKSQLELPDIDSKYGGPVYQYFSRFGKLKTKRELFLSVFYPVAINWPDSKALPSEVTKGNPGMLTVGDYVQAVERKIILSNKNTID